MASTYFSAISQKVSKAQVSPALSNQATFGSNLGAAFSNTMLSTSGASNTVGLHTKFNSNVAVNGTLTVNNLTYLYSNVTVFNAEDVRSNLTVEGTATVTGFVGIGTTTPTAPLHVTLSNSSGQSVLALYDVVAYSDLRLKKDLLRIQGALDKVGRINGYTYQRSDFTGPKRFAGVVAQEVNEVLPEVVSTDADGMLSVAYGNMVALLVEAVKEVRGTVAGLQARLETLEAAAAIAP